MFSKAEHLAGLEHQLSNARKIKDHAEEVRKLVGNTLFRDLILNQFCTIECARYVQESCDPLLTPEQRADALAMAQAAGHLKRWLEITMQMGNSKANEIIQLEEELDHVRSLPEDDAE